MPSFTEGLTPPKRCSLSRRRRLSSAFSSSFKGALLRGAHSGSRKNEAKVQDISHPLSSMVQASLTVFRPCVVAGWEGHPCELRLRLRVAASDGLSEVGLPSAKFPAFQLKTMKETTPPNLRQSRREEEQPRQRPQPRRLVGGSGLRRRNKRQLAFATFPFTTCSQAESRQALQFGRTDLRGCFWEGRNHFSKELPKRLPPGERCGLRHLRPLKERFF